ALRVIDPVHADRKARALQARTQPRYLGSRNRFGGTRRKRIDIDADWKSGNARASEFGSDDVVLNRVAEFLGHVVGEVLSVVVGLEPDEVIGQHGPDQVAMVRHAEHRGLRGPRRVEKKADWLINAQPAQFSTQSQKVIVLNPVGRIRTAEAQQG